MTVVTMSAKESSYSPWPCSKPPSTPAGCCCGCCWRAARPACLPAFRWRCLKGRGPAPSGGGRMSAKGTNSGASTPPSVLPGRGSAACSSPASPRSLLAQPATMEAQARGGPPSPGLRARLDDSPPEDGEVRVAAATARGSTADGSRMAARPGAGIPLAGPGAGRALAAAKGGDWVADVVATGAGVLGGGEPAGLMAAAS
mmetsp:Transcript_26354/g.75654  ORF Transcript_26354/g.75654 Transcript_26354/m.75654 type:complete len:200 (-) Transcript_26354:65-664(-)